MGAHWVGDCGNSEWRVRRAVGASSLQAKTLKGQMHDGTKEKIVKKVLRGYAKGKAGDLIQIGAIPAPHSKDKLSPRERQRQKRFGQARCNDI